ncbi:MAG: hypothetical protein IJX78_06490 [Bacilli bacterium]|nr:hypothetical protein [Bacilli bacterium]
MKKKYLYLGEDSKTRLRFDINLIQKYYCCCCGKKLRVGYKVEYKDVYYIYGVKTTRKEIHFQYKCRECGYYIKNVKQDEIVELQKKYNSNIIPDAKKYIKKYKTRS